MNTPEIRESDYLKAWAAFFACAAVGGAIAGGIAGGILGGLLGVAGSSPDVIKLAGGIAGFFGGLPISYFFFRLFVSRFVVRKLTTAATDDSPNAA